MRLTTKMTMVASGAAFALLAGGGVAAAQPNTEAIVNSTCTYPQVIAAANAQDPAATAQLTSNGLAVVYLQSFVNAPPGSDQRRQLAAQAEGYEGIENYSGLINSVAATCKNFPPA